jgi:hypothetical protein
MTDRDTLLGVAYPEEPETNDDNTTEEGDTDEQ